MELYQNTANALVNYLLLHGYPKNRIAFEWGDRNYAIDIVILANDNVTPISIFEIKGKKTNQSYIMGIEQLRRAVSHLAVNVQCTLVFGKDEEPFFTAFDVTSLVYSASPIQPFDDTQIDSASYFPLDYDYLVSGADPKLLKQKLTSKQERIDRMKIFCWCLVPLAAILLLVLDKQKIFLLTTERLLIIGSVLLVSLLPFFSEISFKEISLKRENNSSEKK